MKGYIFILLFFFSTILVYSQQKKAFLIGIGDYKKELGWKKLNGHKDAEDIQNLLIERGGFNNESIQIITNQEAKYTDVINKLDAFISNLQKNDTVVVYFSGHGQLIEDLNEDESNEDCLDEAFALIDTPNSDKEAKKGYKFEKHLTDDTLGEKYELIRKKIGEHGFLFVMIDACFSGYSLKDVNTTVVDKGSFEPFLLNENTPTNKKQEMSLHELNINDNTIAPMVILCASTNTIAVELKDEKRGALTFAFKEVILNNTSNLSYSLLRYKLQQVLNTYKNVTQVIWMPDTGMENQMVFLLKNKAKYPKEGELFFLHYFNESLKDAKAQEFPYGKLHGLEKGAILKIVNRMDGKEIGFAKVLSSNQYNSLIIFTDELHKKTNILNECVFLPFYIPIFKNFMITSNDKTLKYLKNTNNDFYNIIRKHSDVSSIKNKIALFYDKKKNEFKLMNNDELVYNGNSLDSIYNYLCKQSFYNYISTIAKSNDQINIDLLKDVNSGKYFFQNNKKLFKRIYPILIDYSNGGFNQILPNENYIERDFIIGAEIYSQSKNLFEVELPKNELLFIVNEFVSDEIDKIGGIPSRKLNKSVFNFSNNFSFFFKNTNTIVFSDDGVNKVLKEDNQISIFLYKTNCTEDNCLIIKESYDFFNK